MSETLHSCWQKLVATAPHAVALIDAASGRRYSRGELQQLAATRRAEFPEILLGRRVAFAKANGAGWLATFLALLQAGAVAVPLDLAETPAARRAFAEAIGADFIWQDGATVALGAERRRAKKSSGLALIKLTSGSTGLPKALPFTHAQMLADGRQICATMEIRADDLNLALIPFGHSYGLGNLVVPLLAQGTPILCAAAPLPQVITQNCILYKPTVFPAVPTLLRVLAEADLPTETFTSLRTVISAGSMLAPEIARAFFEKYGRRVHSFYGSSETGGICFDRTGEATLAGRSVGTPLVGVTLSFGRGGRFQVTSAAVGGRGSHVPTDRGELNAQGELVLLGRVGRMAKIAGRRVDLTGMEATLRALVGIDDACVIAHPMQPEQLAAVLATRLRMTEVRALLARELASWKIPKRLVLVAEFPVNARGKTDTKRLRALLES